MKSFEFILALIVLKQLFGSTNITSLYLQSEQLDLGAAVFSIRATLGVLKKFRDNDIHFHELFITAEGMCNSTGCEVPTLDGIRHRKVS